MTFQRVTARLDAMAPVFVDWQRTLTAIPALGPDNGGQGEAEKAAALLERLQVLRPDEVLHMPAPDDRVPGGVRPNMACLWKGRESRRRVWVLSHLDVVPPGEARLWDSDPFVLRETAGRLYGRGVEDNQHGIVSSVLAVQAFKDEGLIPTHDVGLVFVSDEETGSRYGLQFLLEQYPDLFHPSDWIIVPDAGNEEGTLIEVAEKSMLWVKFRVVGKQCHASTPEHGNNSFRATAHLVVALERLYTRFGRRDTLFHPPISTFEPTKKEANVPNVNTIPGEDVFYMDSRVLPCYEPSEILDEMGRLAAEIQERFGVSVEIHPLINDHAAPPTDVASPVVSGIRKAVRAVYDREAEPGGIGGGTVAAFFRRAGLPVAVWCTSAETAHQPNEYCLLDSLINDAKVFAHLFLED